MSTRSTYPLTLPANNNDIRVSFLVPRQSPCDLFIVDRDAMRCKHVFSLYDSTLCVFHCKRDYLWFGLRMG